jgi:hypothetical protein
VQKGLYSTVVENKDSYEGIIKQMEVASTRMHQALEDGQKRIEKVLLIKPDSAAQALGKRVSEIVSNCLEIDIKGDVVKRPRLEDDAQKQRE